MLRSNASALGKGSPPQLQGTRLLLLPRRVHTRPTHTTSLSFSTTTTTHSHLAAPAPLSLVHQRHRPLSLHVPAYIAISPAFHNLSSPRSSPSVRLPSRIPHRPFATHQPTSPICLAARLSASLRLHKPASQQPWATTTAHMAVFFAACEQPAASSTATANDPTIITKALTTSPTDRSHRATTPTATE